MKTFWLLSRLFLTLAFTCIALRLDASPVVLVPAGSEWRYSADGTDHGTAWRASAFNDTTWPSGLAQLGWGDGDEVTALQPGAVTAYFRRAFQSSISGPANLTLRLLRDDGAVVYLNGVEVYRNNMPAGPISYNTLATATVGGPEETTQFVTAPIDPSVLLTGLNVLAVEVHQVTVSSSDLSFDLELIAETAATLPVIDVVATDSDAAESGLLAAIFPGRFTFYRSPVDSNALTVSYILTGSAENGADYRYTSNQVRFNPGQAQTRVDIIPLNDSFVEGTETVVLTLQEPVCAAIVPPPPGCYRVGPSNRAEVFIRDANAPPNQRPQIQLTHPQSGDVFTAPTNIALRALAQDPEDGENLTVEFFANGSSIGFGMHVPALCPGPPCPNYQFIWADPPPGDYSLVARATDSAGASSNSAQVNITVQSGQPETNVTLIALGSVWKYLDNGTDQGMAWREPAFNHSTWATGPAQLGYGDGDESTLVGFGPDPANKYVTTYFRHTFNLINAASFSEIRGRLLQDDGAVVYLNGVEIFRSNMPSGPIGFHTLASSVSPDNQTVEFPVSSSLLVEGVNVVAVEMHQVNANSSDLSFDLELTGVTSTSGSDGFRLVGWGNSYWGQLDIPPDATYAVGIAAGQYHSMALRADGTVALWGGNGADYENARVVPPGLNDVAAISANWGTSMALKRDGTVVPWGVGIGPDYIEEYAGFNPSPATAIAAGGFFALALRENRTVAAWGFNDSGQVDVPEGLMDVVAIAGGSHHSLALKADGTVAGWGYIEAPPSGLSNVVAIAAGGLSALALKADGTVVIWGQDASSPGNSPSHLTDVVAIAHGSDHGLALRQNGTLFAWGENRYGLLDTPSAFSNVVGIATTHLHALALLSDGSPEVTVHPWSRTVRAGDAVSFAVKGVGASPLSVQWQLNESDVPGATSDTLTISSADGSHAGAYRAIIRNAQGTAISHTARLQLDAPPNQQPYVQLNQPQNGDVFTASTDITLSAYAQDREDGFTLTVEFFEGNRSLGLGTFMPTRCASPICPSYDLTWSNVPPGNYTLTARVTDSDGASSNSAPITITVRGEPTAGHELHTVGIHNGRTTNGVVTQQGGHAAVVVDRPGKQVTLFLSAYWPVRWHITVGEGTIIEKVILAGYETQTIEGVNPSVPIQRLYGSSQYLIEYSIDSIEFQQVQARLCTLTGLDISSFHGSIEAPYPAPFVINSVQDDPRLRCDYPQPVDPSELPDLSFHLSFNDGSSGSVVHQDYTLAGPQNGLRLLPGYRVVGDGGGRFYYAAEQHEVWRVDTITHTLQYIDLGPNVPELSWPMGAAFDSQRNRVLVVSLGGEGYLYGYSPSAAQWTVISSMNNRDLNCLVYHPADDSLYGLAPTYGGPPYLMRFSPDGAFQSQFALPVQPFRIDYSGFKAELASAGDYLVLLLETEPVSWYQVERQEARMYLIDPRSGEHWLAYRRVAGADADSDGVPDERDYCPNTPLNANVDGNGCSADQRDSDGDGVPNESDQCPGTASGAVVNAHGCSLAQLCPCAAEWRSHGEYVGCVIRHTWEFFRDGLVTADQRRNIIRDAIQSDCGKRPDRREPICMHLLPLTRHECQRDGVQFVLSGDATGTGILECSEDLIHWRPVGEVSITGWETACPIEPGIAARFYRVRLDE